MFHIPDDAYTHNLGGISRVLTRVINPVPEPETYALMLAGLGESAGWLAAARPTAEAAPRASIARC